MRKEAVRKQFGLLLSAGLFSGCAGDVIRQYSPHYPASQADAGTVTVAVIAIERWQDIVKDLQPAFSISGDSAVSQVLPITQVVQQKLLDAFGVGANISLPTNRLTRVEETRQTDDQPATTTTTETRRTDPGTAAAATVDPVGDRSAASLPGIDLAGGLLQRNPLLQYQTALALFQEVKLLNRYVTSAPLRHGFVPYLVRLQIGVTPYAARQPFDVYTQIGFFNGLTEEQCKEACENKISKEVCSERARRNPEVVPLVVTDDLEATRQSQAAEVVRQLALNLSGTVQNAAVNTQLQALNDQLQAIVGNSLNSLSSVTRLTDNTLQARFGAGNDPSMTGCRRIEYLFGCRSADRAMINRNYFVSLLLLVPEPMATTYAEAEIPMMVKSTLRRIYDGAEVGILVDGQLTERFMAVMQRYRPFLEKEGAFLDRWESPRVVEALTRATSGDREQIQHLLPLGPSVTGAARNQSPPNRFPDRISEAMMTELATLASAYDLQSASLALPRHAEPRLPEAQLAFAVDDQTKATRVRLLNGDALDPLALGAHLRVTTGGRFSGVQLREGEAYLVPTDGIAVSEDLRDLTLTFPSLATLRLPPGSIERLDLRLEHKPFRRYEPNLKNSHTYSTCGGDVSGCTYRLAYRLGARQEGDVNPGFSVRPIVEWITVKDHAGSARVVVGFDDDAASADTVTLTIANAVLAPDIGAKLPGGATADPAANQIIVKGSPGKPVPLVLPLQELVTGETVKIAASGARGAAPTGTATTIQLAVKGS